MTCIQAFHCLEAKLLCVQAQCSEQQVNEYFMRMRSSVRGYLLKLQRKASGKPTGSHGTPASPGIPSAAVGNQDLGKSFTVGAC